MKLTRIEEKVHGARCWFCRTDRSVHYTAYIVNTHPLSPRRYMHIYVCERCAENHLEDLLDMQDWMIP